MPATYNAWAARAARAAAGPSRRQGGAAQRRQALPKKALTSAADPSLRMGRAPFFGLAAAAAAVALAAAALAAAPPQPAWAQDFGGGVDLDGSWYAGEGLKAGDYFSYRMCHVNYKDCTEFRMDMWIEGDVQVGSETKWLMQAAVRDGPSTVKGSMELGKIAPEPSGGTPNLGPYRDAFKTSIVWLSSFATAHPDSKDGPKDFRAPSWGKIANIGGEQVKPTSIEQVSTRAGEFESVLVTWKTGGQVSRIWVVDGFPFPVKASTWTHVSEGIPPQEYRFELIAYEEGVEDDPFADIVDTAEAKTAAGCPKNYDFVKVRKSTVDFAYLVDLKYGPEIPRAGCDIEWIINFHNKFDETEFLHQVQYDILVTDGDGKPVRSLAQEEGRNFLFSASGQVRRFMEVMEEPGTASYAIFIYGLSPEHIVPSSARDYLPVDIEVAESNSAVPGWIKTTAGYWVSGAVSDSEFAAALEFLISEGVLEVPPTERGGGPQGGSIPGWVKTTTGYWTDGVTTDDEFVGAIQFLIRAGIIAVD